jgi:hypothetical protein
MSYLKQKALDFLKNLPESPFDQFNIAFELYGKSSKKSKANQLHYNRIGYSEQGLKNLLYDLQKLNNITDVELHDKQILAEKSCDICESKTCVFEKSLHDNTSDDETPDDETPDDDTSDDEKLNFLNELSEKASAVISEVSGENFEPVNIEELNSLRDELPFLNEEGCPDIMYVIVGRRIVAFRKYQALHAKLQEVNAGAIEISEEEKAQLTFDCEAAFSENRSLWDELEHYANTKEILGKHPMFREDNIKKEVEAMTNEQLFKYINATAKFFTDQKKQLEKHKDNADKIAEINTKIEEREYKLSLVKAKAGVVDAGEKK